MRIAFIGFGEAARAFAASLRRDGVELAAFDIMTASGAGETVRAAASPLGVRSCDTATDAATGADWIISAVTASDSLEAATSVAGALVAGQVFIDINSVSAGRKVETAAIIASSGALYVDMAVMAPVHPRGHRTPVLVAGAAATRIEASLRALEFDYGIVGDEIGAATTIKMLRSLFVKGLEAVTVQTLLAAQAAGRFDEVYASLSKSFPQLGWPGFPLYQLERVGTHGIRRASEMRESAITLAELGFPAGQALADAIADLQQGVGGLGYAASHGDDPRSCFAELLEAHLHKDTHRL